MRSTGIVLGSVKGPHVRPAGTDRPGSGRASACAGLTLTPTRTATVTAAMATDLTRGGRMG